MSRLKELDFLFIYEHKVREFDNLCLMKYELDRRGYVSKIMHIEDAEALKAMRPIYHAKVVVMMACYQNTTIEWHTKNFVKFDKIIDLQWENIVFPRDEHDEKAFKNYSGITKDVVRVSWGEMNRRRMLDVVKMDPRKVKLIGHVGMDFLRDEFKGYYRSREDIFTEYDLPMDKKLFLFISPYFADDLGEQFYHDLIDRFGEGWGEYYNKCMIPSKKIILDWISRILDERDDIIFVYRAHPGEFSPLVEDMVKRYPGFRMINDLSVKQWILVSDRIYTGNSSTFVEAFFAKKMCHFLFPIPVPKDYELAFLKDADRITDFEGFKESLDENEGKFPVSEELIDEVYTIDWETPSYIKFADMAEDVIKDSYYALSKEQLRSYRHKMGPGEKISRFLTHLPIIYTVYHNMLEADNPKWTWLEKRRSELRRLDEIANDFEKCTDEEVEQTIRNISEILENNA